MKTKNFRVDWQYPEKKLLGYTKTICVIEAIGVPPINGTLGLSIGSCTCAKTDTFNKRVGRKLSLQRVLDCEDFTKEERKEIWDAYFALSPKNKVSIK